MFLYRPEYYGITEDEVGNSTQELTEVIVAKHRNGPLGKVSLRYLASLTKFVNFSVSESFGELDDELPFDSIKKGSKANTLNRV
jgi:replicative DNA helicase